MTQEQKKYIEENHDLIKNDEWEKFFEYAPESIGVYFTKQE